jgi:hypothetical protein
MPENQRPPSRERRDGPHPSSFRRSRRCAARRLCRGVRRSGGGRIDTSSRPRPEDVDVCGVTVDVAGEGVFTIRNFFDEEGNFTRFLLTQSDKITYTAANGKSVIVQHTGQQIAPPGVVDETAGTLTTLFTFKGVPAKVQTANGPVLLRDVGLLTATATLDLETDELISFEVLVVNGPHPDLESDFTLFCEVVTEALA